MIDFLLRVFEKYENEDAIVWKDQVFSYGWLLQQVHTWQEIIVAHQIPAGTVVEVEADFSPNGIALFLALIEQCCTVVPLMSSVAPQKREFLEIAEVEVSFKIDGEDNFVIYHYNRQANHNYYQRLRELNHPGLVLFSSGSTGKSKASIHDVTRLLEKYKTRGKRLRTITFLLYDHIGGVDTLLYTLANGACLITLSDRNPDTVFFMIEKYKAEVLPTSPTFLNLVLLSEVYNHYNVNSLKIITYGTEPMPEYTLTRFHELFPQVKLRQKYGLTELGTLRSSSKGSDSLWVKLGGEGYELRVVDNVLHIKAESTMLGYLNAPNPFVEDGWLNTGDMVEVDGEYFKILGRKSDIINVGGEKVYPSEVENIIGTIENIAEVVVYGEKNPITGNIVCARVTLIEAEDVGEVCKRIKLHCRENLPVYKVPVRIEVSLAKQHSKRFKKVRSYE